MGDATVSSLDVVQNFFGQELCEAHLSALKGAPDEQIDDLFVRLNDAWVEWFERRFDKGLTPDKHYFLGEPRDALEPVALNKYKQLALYFPSIATRDPLEAKLLTHLHGAQTDGSRLRDELRRDLLLGIESLMQVAPLVRAGAIELIPAGQVVMSHGVQEVAQREVRSERFSAGAVDDVVEEFALATGLCSKTAYWPVASTDRLWTRLHSGGKNAVSELANCNISISQAVAGFDVPSVTRIELPDLLRLRANEVAFSDFRETFGVAIREAMDENLAHGQKYAEEVLRDRLKVHEARCNERATSAFDGMLLPGAAALMVGGLAWVLATGDNPMGSWDNFEKLLLNTSAPGIAWLVLRVLQQRHRPTDPRQAVYAALVDRVGADE